MSEPIELHGLVWMAVGESNLGGPGRISLLRAIRDAGSITHAARAQGMSYKAAWDAIDTMNNLAGEPLVVRLAGGRGGGSTRLTERGERLIARFGEIEEIHRRFVDALSAASEGLRADLNLIRTFGMHTSARNQFRGTIGTIRRGSVIDEIELLLPGGDVVIATITQSSVERLGLREGATALALVKASSVIVSAGSQGETLSARNRLSGVVQRVETGDVEAEVVIELPGGSTVAATITAESVRRLGLAPGTAATAAFKASSVIIAVEAG